MKTIKAYTTRIYHGTYSWEGTTTWYNVEVYENDTCIEEKSFWSKKQRDEYVKSLHLLRK